jgi:hypothetical protein
MENSIAPVAISTTLIRIISFHIGKNVKAVLKLKVRIIFMVYIDNLVDLDDEDELIKSLKFDGAYNLAICIDCGYGLPLEWIETHFKDIHKLTVYSMVGISNENSLLRQELNG